MKTVKKLLIGAVIFLLLVYGINVWSGRQRQQLPAPSPETVTVTPKPARQEDLDAVYHVCDLLRQNMPENEVHMEFDPESRTVWYRIAKPGLSAEVIELTKVTPSMQDDWNTMVESIVGLQKQMTGYFERNGIHDMTVVLETVNPEDSSEKWLVVANGIAGYDVVNGVDLLNGQS